MAETLSHSYVISCQEVRLLTRRQTESVLWVDRQTRKKLVASGEVQRLTLRRWLKSDCIQKAVINGSWVYLKWCYKYWIMTNQVFRAIIKTLSNSWSIYSWHGLALTAYVAMYLHFLSYNFFVCVLVSLNCTPVVATCIAGLF